MSHFCSWCTFYSFAQCILRNMGGDPLNWFHNFMFHKVNVLKTPSEVHLPIQICAMHKEPSSQKVINKYELPSFFLRQPNFTLAAICTSCFYDICMCDAHVVFIIQQTKYSLLWVSQCQCWLDVGWWQAITFDSTPRNSCDPGLYIIYGKLTSNARSKHCKRSTAHRLFMWEHGLTFPYSIILFHIFSCMLFHWSLTVTQMLLKQAAVTLGLDVMDLGAEDDRCAPDPGCRLQSPRELQQRSSCLCSRESASDGLDTAWESVFSKVAWD